MRARNLGYRALECSVPGGPIFLGTDDIENDRDSVRASLALGYTYFFWV